MSASDGMRVDFATLLVDIVSGSPCEESTLVCFVRAAVDYLILTTVALAILVSFGFLIAISFQVVAARFARARTTRPSRRRLLSGPVHSDGAWVRFVEDERGRRIVEVLEGGTWRPSTRSLSQFTIDVPLEIPPRS